MRRTTRALLQVAMEHGNRAAVVSAIVNITWMAQRMQTSIDDLEEGTWDDSIKLFSAMSTFVELDDQQVYDHIPHDPTWSEFRIRCLKMFNLMAAPL